MIRTSPRLVDKTITPLERQVKEIHKRLFADCLLAMLVLELLTPHWWWIMIVPFAYGAAAGSGWKALRTGFLAAGLLWLGASAYLFLSGSRIIAGRMAAMFGLGDSWLKVAATGLVAGLAAAFSAYAGYAVRALFKKR